MSIINRPYEISVWDDVIKGEEGYIEEQKLAIIGSNTMTAQGTPLRAHSPKFETNTNGTSTLTFMMYYKYYDSAEGKLLDNPFIPYLVNERKIKFGN